jgi:sugar lactone lactonase YvrE
VLSSERVYRFPSGSTGSTPGVEVASGLSGANGIAFDGQGGMYVTDGGTGQGRVWRVTPSGEVQEAFRVQTMANDVNAVDGVGGVGRDVRSLPPGSVRFTPTGRSAADSEGSQLIVANGVAFNPQGNLLYIADTARGAIWMAEIDASGTLLSQTGCDTTYPSNTLCLDSLLVAHPALAGADGIALDAAGNIWVTAQERNAVVVVSPEGQVTEVFRNAPDPDTQLRNTGPLEFPTSPFLDGTTLCLVHTDGNRGDNAPASAGELAPGSPQQGKISCMNEPLQTPGLPLPVQ